jgi:translation initiation factor 2 subunit 1
MASLAEKDGSAAAEPEAEEEEHASTTVQMTADEAEEERRYQLDPGQKLACRFYENQYPELEELVMVNVRNIDNVGVYVTLLEYNNIEGMILLSELSRRRIRSVNKLIRVGRNEVVSVLRVDREKGYIDLSKKTVVPEDVGKAEDRFNKAKAVHRVLRQVAEQKGMVLKTLYQQVGWPLYKKYGHCYDAFRLVLTDQEDIFTGLEVDKEVVATLTDYIKKRLAPQPIKVRADVEVTCFTYEGIDAVRAALLAGQEVGTKESPVKIRLIGPPMYVVTTTTLDKDVGIELLNKALAEVTRVITEKLGKIDVKMAPKAVSAREETELQAMMERLALENAEMDGDEEEADADLAA